MYMKILEVRKKSLILVIIRLSQNNMMIQAKLAMAKWKMKPEVLQLKNLLDWLQKLFIHGRQQ